MSNITDNLATILTVTGLEERDLIALYPYGSRVYATNTFYSDHDYQLVYDPHFIGDFKDGEQFDSMTGDISVHVHTIESWQRHLDNHKIFALESYSLMNVEMFKFNLDLPTLRKEISATASNSWVKAKKKITVERGQKLNGLKSLFHSFRIPAFGIQIAEHGKVVDFGVANHIWDELRVLDLNTISWDTLNEKWKSRHNELMTEFRKYAPKE
ncbi:hypothetical protein Xoosp13_201 [Xanthomonas phage Xoo-sp13]|nr:hypothetical protein Xoosp13_201 [Xanthomonas phage Xoo-sp13]